MSDQNGTQQVVQIAIDQIVPNPNQPRERFDEAKLQELANSIREKGLIQPVTVRRLDSNGTYELVAGERRFRACQLLELTTVDAIVREMTAEESREIALIENLQRDDLSIMEEVRSIEGLTQFYGNDRQVVADKIGKSLPYVNERLDLLFLPAEIRQMLDDGKVNLAQARVILEIEGEEVQIEAANRAIKLNLTANELRGRMQRHLKGADDDVGKPASKSGKVSYNQLSSDLVRTFDDLEGFDYHLVRDPNKRDTLKKQLSLLRDMLTDAVERLNQPVEPTGTDAAAEDALTGEPA